MEIKIKKILLACLVLLSISACNVKYNYEKLYNYRSCNKKYGYLNNGVAVYDLNGDSTEKMNSCIYSTIRSVIFNQYFITYNFKKIDSINNLLVNSNKFYNSNKKILFDADMNDGNYTFKNKGYYLNLNYSNLNLKIENVSSCFSRNDSFNQIISGYSKNNKFLVYRVSGLSYKFGLYEDDLINKELSTLNNIYFAISTGPMPPINVSKAGFDYMVLLPLSPKIINYEITLKNLARFFESFNKNKQESYVPFLKMALCGKYTDKIMTAVCYPIDSGLSKFKDLTYTKSKGTKFHFYTFYSEIYKTDMLVRLDTKHPEKIKVKTYKP